MTDYYHQQGRSPRRQQPLQQDECHADAPIGDEPSARRCSTPGLPSLRRLASQARTADPLERHPCSHLLLRQVRAIVSRKADHMQQTLWGKKAPRPRRKRKIIQLPPAAPPYSITGTNDCEILGHTLNAYDLAGCSTCLECGVRVFCPGCVQSHPQDEHAVPVRCQRHEESTVSA